MSQDIQWNDTAILAAAGETPDAVQAILARHNQPVPTAVAVYQWTSRRNIPNLWRPRLIYAVLRENKLPIAKLFRLGNERRRPGEPRK